MRFLFVYFSIFVLTGCGITIDGCTYHMTYTPCDGEQFPRVAFYQKKDTVGRTNAEIRWNDAKHCGADYREPYLFSDYRYKSKLFDYKSEIKHFDNCMSKLGYIKLTVEECGRMNSVSDKKKCNM
ncbi:hypothetical protein [Lonepinella sp. BR2357]|uniref:hypothetical protein n=1 Tax=Lonepinella sp. BR2357 TaxID=3434549 RepID=UPI003F6DA68A